MAESNEQLLLPSRNYISASLLYRKIQEIYPEISHITNKDAKLYKNITIGDQIRYANSWLYLLRATRSDKGDYGLKIAHDQMVLFFGFRNNSIFITNPIGENIKEFLIEFCSRITSLNSLNIVIRKVNFKFTKELLESGFFVDIQKSAQPEWLEDDMFHEHMIYLDKLFLKDYSINRSADNLSRWVKKFNKRSVFLEKRTLRDEVDFNMSSKALEQISGTNKSKYYAYLPMIQSIFSDQIDRSNFELCIYSHNGEYHGLYISELLEKETVGLYCAISSRAIPGITEWMDVDFLRKSYQNGIKRILLGGSETQGVDVYIKKLIVDRVDYPSVSLMYKKNGTTDFHIR